MIESKFFKIKKNQKLIEVYKSIEKNKIKNKNLRVAIKFNKKGNVDGIMSLGDIRRNIINNPSKLIYSLLNYDPAYININEKKKTIIEKNIKKISIKNISDIIITTKKKFLDIISFNEFFNNFHFSSITIVGAGHIGVPLSVFLLEKINSLALFDKNPKSLSDVKKMKLPFYEKGLTKILKKKLIEKRINFINDLNSINSNIYIICVGTDVKKNKINNNNLIKLLEQISKRIYKNCTILIRGTLQVGFSNSIAIKILENGSKLKCGIDFYYGYIPERLVEGDALNELKTIPQLISGQTDECLKRVQAICNFFFPKTIKLKSCAEAEIIKLATNSVRDLNFVFANEISRISNIYNLSGFEVIKKANQDYPRNNIAKPSVGVGGFCLPKDPFIFKKLLKNKNDGYRFSVSREVNSLATMENLKRVIKIKNKYLKNKKIKILIMGISFKGTPETIDIRNSVSLNLGLQLQKYKFHNVSFLDVMGKKIKDRFKLKIKLCNDKDLNKQDIILLTNNNPLYKDIVYSKLKNNTKAKKIIYDFTDMLDENLCSAIGYVYKKL